MEDIKKFMKRFNACGNCGCGNFALDVFRNNHPDGGFVAQCTECGRNYNGKTVQELLEKWNADVFKKPEKKEIKVAKIPKALPIDYYDKRRAENKSAAPVQTNPQNMSCAELADLADKLEEARYSRAMHKMCIEQMERDRRRAKELSWQKFRTGYLSPLEEEQLENAMLSGLLT